MKANDSVGSGASPLGKPEVVLLACFALLNMLILAIAAVDAPYVHGADAQSWLLPARALIEYGDLVEFNDPERLQTFRPPLYPIVVALGQLISTTSYVPLVLFQVVLLGITGWVTRSIVAMFVPQLATVAMALVLFNPSALGTAHLLQSDTLYACVVTVTVWTVFRYAQQPGIRIVLMCGVAFGLVTMTRNTAQFLLYALPLALPILVLAGRQNVALTRSVLHGCLVLLVALLMTTPWIAHMVRADEGVTLSSIRIKSAFLWDNVTYLEKFEADIGLTQAELRTRETQAKFIEEQGATWLALDERAQHQQMFDFAVREFLGYSVGAYVRAYGWGAAQFFAIPGVSNLLNVLELNERTPFAIFRASAVDNYWDAGLTALSEASPWATVITVAGFMYVLPLRVLGLLGMFVAWRRKQFVALVVIAAVVGYFAMIHLFVGNSRYRLPVEPLLVLAAAFGWSGLRAAWTTFTERRRR